MAKKAKGPRQVLHLSVPEEVYSVLADLAKEHLRPVNSEVLVALREWFKANGRAWPQGAGGGEEEPQDGKG